MQSLPRTTRSCYTLAVPTSVRQHQNVPVDWWLIYNRSDVSQFHALMMPMASHRWPCRPYLIAYQEKHWAESSSPTYRWTRSTKLPFDGINQSMTAPPLSANFANSQHKEFTSALSQRKKTRKTSSKPKFWTNKKKVFRCKIFASLSSCAIHGKCRGSSAVEISRRKKK